MPTSAQAPTPHPDLLPVEETGRRVRGVAAEGRAQSRHPARRPVGGLYLYSPDDISDALLLVSPTPFAVYGVIGLCGVVLTALLVALRARSGMRYVAWRIVHNVVSLVVVVSSVVHAVLIEGAMGFVSKAILCGLVVAAATIGLLRVHMKWPRTKDL